MSNDNLIPPNYNRLMRAISINDIKIENSQNIFKASNQGFH